MITRHSDTLVFKNILDYMRDGVLTVDRQGRIITLNPAAARILALDPVAALGQTLAETLFAEEGSDEFSQIIFDAIYESVPVQRKLVPYRRGGEERLLSVTTSSLVLDPGEGRDSGGVICVFSDVTEMERLREAEAKLAADLQQRHGELQKAYIDLETAHSAAETMGKRINRFRIIATGGVIVLFVAIGLFSWWQSAAAIPGAVRSPASSGPLQLATLTVEPRPVRLQISLAGTISPGSVVNVVGPFDGPVKEKLFAYGGRVERGDKVLVMDTSELEIRVRDARGALIKAERAVQDLKTWESSSDVARAKASVLTAQMAFDDGKRKIADTKMLLDRGIVAGSEYDSLVQQQRSQELQLQGAERDLRSVLDKANPGNVQVADFELANAKAKAAELEAQLANAVIYAPVSGVVLRPEKTSDTGEAKTIEVGARVTKGQTMFSIGNLETLVVAGQVDEVDINKVAIGQAVEVTNDALSGPPLIGRVIEVSTQADSTNGLARGLPSFAVKVEISELSPEQRAHLHVGMSASMSILTYDNPQAIVVPLPAIHGPRDKASVALMKPDGKVEEVPVKIGATMLDGVEVSSGLQAGDKIVLGGAGPRS